MYDSLKIREFSNAIANFINGSDLPAEVKRLALAEILHKLEVATDNVITTEIKEREVENDGNN